MQPSTKKPDFSFLVDTAKKLGVKEAKIIPAAEVFVENRVPLKCRAGCIGYGKKLTCPPMSRRPMSSGRCLRNTGLRCW